MTGYGRAEANFNDKTILIEVKSLNGKQFDARLNIPAMLKPYEVEIRNKLNEELVIKRDFIDKFKQKYSRAPTNEEIIEHLELKNISLV